MKETGKNVNIKGITCILCDMLTERERVWKTFRCTYSLMISVPLNDCNMNSYCILFLSYIRWKYKTVKYTFNEKNEVFLWGVHAQNIKKKRIAGNHSFKSFYKRVKELNCKMIQL